MSQEQLTDYLFIPEINEDKLQYVLRKKKTPVSIRRLRQVKIHMEMKWSEELPKEAFDILDSIKNLGEALHYFKQSEIVVIVLRYLDNLMKGVTLTKAINEAACYHVENWEESMRRLPN